MPTSLSTLTFFPHSFLCAFRIFSKLFSRTKNSSVPAPSLLLPTSIQAMVSRLLWVVLTIPMLISAQELCHPFPGAAATDVLELISKHLQNDSDVLFSSGRAAITLRTASIVTLLPQGQSPVDYDYMARSALTTVGACAKVDLGSISGVFVDPKTHVKICYLYPNNEAMCTL